MGEFSSWSVGIILCLIFMTAFSAFYLSGTSSTYYTAPFPTNSSQPDLVVFKGIGSLQAASNQISDAINRLRQPDANIITDAMVFADIGVALIKIVFTIPMIIGGFIYDIANALFIVLPDDPSGTLVTIIGLVVLMVMLILMFAVAAMIRSPGTGSY